MTSASELLVNAEKLSKEKQEIQLVVIAFKDGKQAAEVSFYSDAAEWAQNPHAETEFFRRYWKPVWVMFENKMKVRGLL